MPHSDCSSDDSLDNIPLSQLLGSIHEVGTKIPSQAKRHERQTQPSFETDQITNSVAADNDVSFSDTDVVGSTADMKFSHRDNAAVEDCQIIPPNNVVAPCSKTVGRNLMGTGRTDQAQARQIPKNEAPSHQVNNPSRVRNIPSFLPAGFKHPVFKEAMVEANAWRPAIMVEAQGAYNYCTSRTESRDSEHHCAVMNVSAVRNVMVCIGYLLGAEVSEGHVSMGPYVILRRSRAANALPVKLDAFKRDANKVLDSIIVREYIQQYEEKENRSRVDGTKRRTEKKRVSMDGAYGGNRKRQRTE